MKSDKIINNISQLYTQPEKKEIVTDVISCSIAISLGLSFLATLLIIADKWPSFMFITIPFIMVGSLLFAMMGGLASYNYDVKASLPVIYYFVLHGIMPNKALRSKQLEEIVIKAHEQFLQDNFVPSSPKFENLTKYNLKEWVDTHVGSAKSLQNLFQTRVLGSSELKMDLVYWSQLLPKDRLSTEQYRTVLQACQLIDVRTIINIPSQISPLFDEYSPEDIVRLFTSPYNVEDYFKALQIAFKLRTKFVRQKNIFDLVIHMNILEKEFNSNNFVFKHNIAWAKKIEGEFSLGKVVYIKDHVGLEKWGYLMSNCLKVQNVRGQETRDNIKNGSFYAYGIYRNNKPVMCFTLDKDGYVFEVKKKYNKLLTIEESSALRLYVINQLK